MRNKEEVGRTEAEIERKRWVAMRRRRATTSTNWARRDGLRLTLARPVVSGKSTTRQSKTWRRFHFTPRPLVERFDVVVRERSFVSWACTSQLLWLSRRLRLRCWCWLLCSSNRCRCRQLAVVAEWWAQRQQLLCCCNSCWWWCWCCCFCCCCCAALLRCICKASMLLPTNAAVRLLQTMLNWIHFSAPVGKLSVNYSISRLHLSRVENLKYSKEEYRP